MPGAQVSPTRVDPDQAAHRCRPGRASCWLITWLAGNLIGAAVIVAAGGTRRRPMRRCGSRWSSALGLWTPMLVACGSLRPSGRHPATGSEVTVRRRLRTAVQGRRPRRRARRCAVATGRCCARSTGRWSVAGRTRSAARRVERNARDLYDQAHGGWLVVLVLIVVVGAPFVEELMYRGLLQGARSAGSTTASPSSLVAAFFALDPLPLGRVPGAVRVRVGARRVRAAHRPARDGHPGAHGVQRHRAVAGGRAVTA